MEMIEALKYLFAVIKWKFSPKKWTGTHIYFLGKQRQVIGETFNLIFVKGIKTGIRKDNRFVKNESRGKN